jgi:UDP:flavonoid glycosyltransferase YjiC (YdhE family)
VVAGGGYSLMGEAVHLHVPMLSVPIGGQYEQELNARYLEKLGYGAFAETPNADAIRTFLERTDAMSAALASYVPRDNSMLFGCVDELIEHVRLGHPPPERLSTAALGAFAGGT